MLPDQIKNLGKSYAVLPNFAASDSVLLQTRRNPLFSYGLLRERSIVVFLENLCSMSFIPFRLLISTGPITMAQQKEKNASEKSLEMLRSRFPEIVHHGFFKRSLVLIFFKVDQKYDTHCSKASSLRPRSVWCLTAPSLPASAKEHYLEERPRVAFTVKLCDLWFTASSDR